MKPKAIFFDVDGTIISLEVIVKTFQSCCRQLNARILTKNEIMDNAISYKLSEALDKLLPEVDYERFKKCFEITQINNFKKYSKILPFVKSTFNFINKKRIKIGIVTTKSRSEALAILNGYDLPFNTLVAGDDVKKRKPDPEPVLKACENLNLNPRDCLFVGDHPFDMMAAKSAGCFAVGTLTGWGNKKNLKSAGADDIIKNLSSLKKLIE
jgi:pyrophosphatase PpaX